MPQFSVQSGPLWNPLSISKSVDLDYNKFVYFALDTVYKFLGSVIPNHNQNKKIMALTKIIKYSLFLDLRIIFFI